jgi:hypothetical protein
MLETESVQNKQMLMTLQMLLDSFIKAANENDVILFPKLADNPELRARAIGQTVKELKHLTIHDANLKKIVREKLARFDGTRVVGKAFAKKAKLDVKSLNESAPAFSEFKKLIPYLDMSYPNQREGPPETLNKKSLLSVYWKIRSSTVEEVRLKGRKYWE